PDHEIADGPAVPVDELRLGGEGDQLLEQCPPLLDRPADDVRGVRSEVEAGAARVAVVADQRLPHRRQFLRDLVVEIGKADLAARAEDAVLDDEPVELALARLRQRVPGRPHIGELGLAAPDRTWGRQLAGREQRALRRDALNELSVCQSWFPRLNKLRRSSRASTRPSGSKLEMSARS